MERPVDPLFEFDAPQMFVDLTRALHDYAPPLEQHRPQDPWFDAVHPEHSRPSDEFAQEAHAAVKARTDKAAQQTPGRVPANTERKDRGSSIKTKASSAESAQDPSDKENQDVIDRRPRADGTLRRMPMRMLRTKAAPLEKAAEARPVTKAAVKTAVNRGTHKTAKSTVGLKRKAGQTVQSRNRSLTSELAESSASSNRRRQPSTSAISIRSATATSARVVATSATVRKTNKSSEKSDLRDLEELLARHNKRFKPTHTYEPPQHSVRDVKAWERQTNQSYYKLTSQGRVKANQEIAAWLKNQQQRAG